jgi:UDP-2,3-diacylglucosamine pyrophosphatase LpxH
MPDCICHIHHATIHNDFGFRRLNCGDWVGSCTAIAEHRDGCFEIITWTQSATRDPAAYSAELA